MNAYNSYSPLDLCNQAFRALGEKPITSFTDPTNPRALLAQQFYAQVRDTLLGEHFWNFATVRTTLYSYSTPGATLTPATPTGTGVLFTAGGNVFGLDAVGQGITGLSVPGAARITGLVTSTPAAALTPGALASQVDAANVPFIASTGIFTAADVGSVIEALDIRPGLSQITSVSSATTALGVIWHPFDPGVALPAGVWRLYKTDRVIADITASFTGATIPAYGWSLSEPRPGWGYGYRFRIPEDMIAMQRTQDSAEYQREGYWLLSDEPTLSITYTSVNSDLRRWPPYFVSALVAALTAAFAEQITGQQAKHQLWLQLAESRLRRAKVHDGREGTPPVLRSDTLIRARFRGRG